MKCSIHVRENHDQANSLIMWLIVILGALLVTLFLTASAAAGTAYYSAQGWLSGQTTNQFFDFDITSTLRAPAPFSLRTWHYGGGTNAAGDIIPAGSFDPILELWGPGGLLVQNDDGPYGLDSLIDWATPGMPLQLAAGSYGVRLFPYSGNGNWAVDLVADAAKFTLTDAGYYSSTGSSAITSLKLGSDDVRTPARLTIDSWLELYHYSTTEGQLVLGNTGSALAVLGSSGKLDTGHSILGFSPGSLGTLTITTGGAWEDFGTYDATSVGLSGKGILEVQSYGRAIFDYGLKVARLSGSEGHVTVSGPGSQLSTYWNLEVGVGGAGTLQIDNQGFVNSRLVGTMEEDVVASLSGSTGTVDVMGFNSRWHTDSLTIGNGGQGIVRITSGGLIDTFGNAHIGKSANASASSVTVAGMSSQSTKATWLVSRDLHIAGSAAGPSSALNSVLSIGAGGLVDVYGTTTVWNPGGALMLLGGEMETGALVVKPGATFTHTDGTLTINGGVFDPGVTDYRIDGAGAADLPNVQLINGATASISTTGYPLTVGKYHRGRLEILNGSQVVLPNTYTYGSLIIGDFVGSDGEVVVDGQGSSLTANWYLTVGNLGRGVLRIRNGGSVESSYPYIAALSGSVGIMEVSGTDPMGEPSNFTTDDFFFIGFHGNATLTVSAGGRVNALNGATMAAEGGFSSATVTNTNSRWAITGPLYVGGNAYDAGGGGNLTVANGGQVISGSVKVWQPGTVVLDGGVISTNSLELSGGTLRGSGTIVVSSQLTNSGVVSPGLLAGVITVAGGNYVQDSAGTLKIEIGGAYPSQYDQLNVVSGSAMLGGTLDVSLIDPTGGTNVYSPNAGDVFHVVTVGGTVTTPEWLALPTLRGGLVWWIGTPNPHSLDLGVAGVLGDYNLNGVVDDADYVIWRKWLNQPTWSLRADGNGNGYIDIGDYEVWRAHFGQIALSAAVASISHANAVIAEPAARWLMCLGMSMVLFPVARTRLRKMRV
jgi:T5SS/PEP-CTERM-associated repeat protein